jgi:hypothetical protein
MHIDKIENAFAVITVSRVSERDEDASINSGLVVTIKATK